MNTNAQDRATATTFPYADKLFAVLSGCAYGDAWGNTNEFKPYGQLTRASKLGPELPTRLVITDDTQMTLSLARAIHTAGTADHVALRAAIIAEYVEWLRDPDNNRAPGNTCLSATRALAGGAPWTRATVVASDGCGTVMRTSPAAFLPDHLWRPVAAWQAAITHGKASGIAAALVTAAIIREALRGAARPGHLVAYAIELASHPALRAGVGEWLVGHPQAPTAHDADAFLAAGLREVVDALQRAHSAVAAFQSDPWADDPCRFAGEGWRAQEALSTALLCADALPGDPIAALRRATVTGGDSDSIAAVAGAILGAAQADNPWPAQWAQRLKPRYRTWIADAAQYRLGDPK